MSVPQEVIQRMMSGGGGGAAPGMTGAPAAGPPGTGPAAAPPPAPQPAIGGSSGGRPQGSPLSGPQNKEGLKTAALTNVHIAVNMLEEALPAFGSESPEGQKIIRALGVIGPLITKKDNTDLVPAEILSMVRRLPQMGGGTNVQRQILQQMMSAKGNSPQQTLQ